jgi:hypothetical protein
MSEDVAAASTNDPVKTVANAMEAAIRAARDGAIDAKAAAEKTIPKVTRFASRFVYTACYTISYGVVFPAVLLSRAIPRNNAAARGLADGARAAIDMVDDLRARRSGTATAGPIASITHS